MAQQFSAGEAESFVVTGPGLNTDQFNKLAAGGITADEVRGLLAGREAAEGLTPRKLESINELISRGPATARVSRMVGGAAGLLVGVALVLGAIVLLIVR